MVRMPWQENNVYFMYTSIWTEMLSIIRKGVEKKAYFEFKKNTAQLVSFVVDSTTFLYQDN